MVKGFGPGLSLADAISINNFRNSPEPAGPLIAPCPASIKRLPVGDDEPCHPNRRSSSPRSGHDQAQGSLDRDDVTPSTDWLVQELREIPPEKCVTPEEADHPPQSEKRPEWQRILPRLAAAGQQRCGQEPSNQYR